MSSDVPRFFCNYAGCARSYKKKEHLLRHERDHLNLRPFACMSCPATFNRSDLLKRHEAISHQSDEAPEQKDQREPSTENAVSESQKSVTASEPVDTSPVIPDCLLSIELEGLNLSLNPTMQLLQSSSRNELEASYFLHFHPHWPLLHKRTFLQSKHPPELTAAVLTAGLWVLDTPETREKARFYHDALLKVLDDQLFKLRQPATDSSGPRPEFLASFQVLLIALILCTYRGAETFPSAFFNSKHLWGLFQSMGVYDQKAIDDRNSSPIIRECYQRLALLHFKFHVHLNSILMRHFPQFKTFNYLTLNMLKVRIPLPSLYWEGDDAAFLHKGQEAETVADLVVPCIELTRVSDLVAWDFTLGMVAGCYLVRPAEEGHRDLIKRLEPFLFVHLNSLKCHSQSLSTMTSRDLKTTVSQPSVWNMSLYQIKDTIFVDLVLRQAQT